MRFVRSARRVADGIDVFDVHGGVRILVKPRPIFAWQRAIVTLPGRPPAARASASGWSWCSMCPAGDSTCVSTPGTTFSRSWNSALRVAVAPPACRCRSGRLRPTAPARVISFQQASTSSTLVEQRVAALVRRVAEDLPHAPSARPARPVPRQPGRAVGRQQRVGLAQARGHGVDAVVGAQLGRLLQFVEPHRDSAWAPAWAACAGMPKPSRLTSRRMRAGRTPA